MSDIERWAGGGPLFDSVVVFENYPIENVMAPNKENSLHVENLRTCEQTDSKLTLYVELIKPAAPNANAGAQLQLHFDYRLQYFDAAAIALIGEHYVDRLRRLAGAGFEMPVGDL